MKFLLLRQFQKSLLATLDVLWHPVPAVCGAFRADKNVLLKLPLFCLLCFLAFGSGCPAPQWCCAACGRSERQPVICFRLVAENSEWLLAGRGKVPPPDGLEWVKRESHEEYYLVEKKRYEFFSVARIDESSEREGNPLWIFEFYPDDAKRLSDLTRNHIGRKLAVFVFDELLCAPQIMAAIDDGRIQVVRPVGDTASLLEGLKRIAAENHSASVGCL